MLVANIMSLLAVAAAGLLAGRLARLPPIVAYLLAGVVAGPAGLAVVARAEGIETIAELGVALLLFGVGIEFSLEPLRRAVPRMLAGGIAQVTLTIFTAALLFRGFGTPWPSAVFVGFLVSLSSTAIVFKLYSDEGGADTPHGQATAGLLLFQDLALVPMMLLVPVLTGPMEDAFQAAISALFRAAVAVGGLIVLARAILPRVLSAMARAQAPELFPLVALLIAFGTAVGATQLGLSLPLGMFLAGLALLTAGCAIALKERLPEVCVQTVEPETFDDTARSLEAGERLSVDATARSICDALQSPSPGHLTFPIIQKLTGPGLAVSDDEVREAMRFSFRHLKLVIEPGGAVALAAVLSGKLETSGLTTVVVISGGNVDIDLFAAIQAEPS